MLVEWASGDGVDAGIPEIRRQAVKADVGTGMAAKTRGESRGHRGV